LLWFWFAFTKNPTGHSLPGQWPGLFILVPSPRVFFSDYEITVTEYRPPCFQFYSAKNIEHGSSTPSEGFNEYPQGGPAKMLNIIR
jgi:hypothetical protein